MTKEKIGKVAAAERNLKTAVRLFFRREDPVSIYLLIQSSYAVINDIAGKRGLTLQHSFNNYVKEEYIKEIARSINRPANFCKHADSDHDGVLEFNPDFIPQFLYLTIGLFADIESRLFHEGLVFQCWYCLKNPHFVKNKSLKSAIEISKHNNISSDDFDIFLMLCDRKFYDEHCV
ncbi:hypothetical protein EPN96_12475 [bacterium]|nr:MAG: hypothetical protein EPN96_12475 [bacterium]